ncbi:hypothetical protein JHK87_027204 [Glycine soja]|nr:hypothetical protein JHK87_027204 [Glycine soja]
MLLHFDMFDVNVNINGLKLCSLLVEEDKVRQNRCVVLITNVKPGKLRDVMSQGLVLCASNEGPTIVEPLLLHKDHKLGSVFLFLDVGNDQVKVETD